MEKEFDQNSRSQEDNNFIIECSHTTLDLRKNTLIMGILNITPNSFSDGGRYLKEEEAVEHAEKMVSEGADIIDVGGESSRPGAKPVSEEEEMSRVIPVIKKLSIKIDCPISIDTTKSAVARKAIDVGAQIINDISALRFDPRIGEVAADFETPLIMMHMRGTPETMQLDLNYDSLIPEIIYYLTTRIEEARRIGVDPQKIIIDPGIGFGKSTEDNLRIIKGLKEFKVLKKPLLIGTSRKSFIGNLLGLKTDDREEGTAATIAVGVMNGANIVRVHNVMMAKRVCRMVDAIKDS